MSSTSSGSASETDRRGSVAVLTEDGLAAFDEAAAIHVEAVASGRAVGVALVDTAMPLLGGFDDLRKL